MSAECEVHSSQFRVGFLENCKEEENGSSFLGNSEEEHFESNKKRFMLR